MRLCVLYSEPEPDLPLLKEEPMRNVIRQLTILVLIALALGPFSVARAQGGSQHFPETGHSVRDPFLSYWRQHGGLPVFGYPLSDQIREGGHDVQYFERQRFEGHPQNAPPYHVLLGRLGDELLRMRGIDWQADVPPAAAIPGCVWFRETRHNLCDQSPSAGFRSYWTSHGLEFDGQAGASYAESLALFGYPLTEVYTENIEGQPIQVQWFERARFEWHPGNPNPYKVLLGRLGAELVDARPAPQPPTFTEVQIFFVAIGDAGQSGQPIGCGDSLVPVTVQVEPTTTPMTAAYQSLLAVDSQYYGQSGLYNALYQSQLTLVGATVDQSRGVATVRLSGSLTLGGVCDNPRVQAQLEQVALQFSTVQQVEIFINNRPLAEVLSEQ